ncbi:hypothetical protein T439DRAFT_329314 [Meredithblackwellia eburnea MCA 4105]
MLAVSHELVLLTEGALPALELARLLTSSASIASLLHFSTLSSCSSSLSDSNSRSSLTVSVSSESHRAGALCPNLSFSTIDACGRGVLDPERG